MSTGSPGDPDHAGSSTLSAEAARLFQELPFLGMAVTSAASKRWLQVNQTLCDMLGYPRDELVARTWADLTHPDDLAIDLAEFERVTRGEIDGYKMDKRFVRRDGALVHATIDVKAVRGADGTIDFFIAIIADITARVTAEATARTAAALLRELGRQVPGVLYQYRQFPDGRSCFPFASEAIRDVYAVTPDQVRDDAAPVFARLHPDDLERVAASIADSARTLEPWRCDYRVILPKPGVRWLSGHAQPQRLPDGSTLWHGYITDSTDRERARQALAESEQRYRILVEHAPEAIVVLDAEAGRFTDANPNAEQLFGWSRAQLLQRGVVEVSPELQPDGQRSDASAAARVRRALAGEPQVFEWVHRHASGADVPCEIRLTPLPFAGRQQVRGSITDVSERKRARDTMRRLQAAIESSMSGVAMADLEGRLTYVNRAFLALWGYADPTEVLGREVRSFWRSPEEAAAVVAALGTGTWSGELVARRLDGTERTLLVNASLFADETGAPGGMLGAFTDVTEARHLQAQLVQSQKLESIGRLAGGIAHDFNNLLTVIKGYLSVAMAAVRAAAPVHADLLEVDRAADSAAALTRQLLAVSRRQIISPVVLDLNAVVHRIRAMLQRVLGEDVALTVTTAPDLRRVRFDPAQAEQVLLNLAVNARDAMPAGGRLTIETANVRLSEDYARTHPDATPGDYVMLAVSDTGTGMPDEVRAHAFEPFFTTKNTGHGSGLGLAMVHGAVAQNDGRIELYTEHGRGTSFKIYLPATIEPAAAPATPQRAEIPRGHETIMLVEDDDAVRRLAQRLLEHLGYQVRAFSDGPSALAWLEAAREPVDLLLSDVIMPGMNGPDLAAKVTARSPGTKVLFVSGYTANVIVHHGVVDPGVEFLAKPYTSEALANRLRALLER